MSVNDRYSVEWSRTALRRLFTFQRIDHDQVYQLSLHFLGKDPFAQADKTADYENYAYNGFCLKMIRNVVVVYSVDVKSKKVRIRACHHGGSGDVAQILYGIEPPFTND
ncbi:hypothetical protein [Paenibacillus sp. LHD-38]|uniref:hypothetical protein n=1 Tax=Paenibacillus sp. LHD-38 TaxID=3072143 RepID=UPI00280CF387|nr:hypothetical protein [Paenibacillus sp. LHD-38]MDQ8735778.1 hypothetical protein [Paenibacillus sp. LHD-38]